MLSRRGLKVVCLACVMASADDTACALQKAVGKPKVRDNYVYFHQYDLTTSVPPRVQSVQFNATSHAITQGQPYEGVSSLGYYLDVRAGRHKSEWVANDFNAGLTPDNAWHLDEGGGGPETFLPSELNFALFGNLSVTIDGATRVCPEMRLAQGHIVLVGDNNWWIAGTQCHQTKGAFYCASGLRCPCGVTFHGCATQSDFEVEFD